MIFLLFLILMVLLLIAYLLVQLLKELWEIRKVLILTNDPDAIIIDIDKD